MLTPRLTSSTLIAPCGINCGVCRAHLRERNPCPGCRGNDAGKPKTRIMCKIKICEKRVSGKIQYCSSCNEFPCQTLRHLDDRYRTNYGMSVIDNLLMIKTSGIRTFLASEEQKWVCPACGGALCVHEPRCLSCGRTR
jgi:Protein of unknown function (DUF3795)